VFPVRYELNLYINYLEEIEDRINDQHKNCIKTHEAKWPLNFIGGKYDCAGESQLQL
jgi:hypothetical protein